MNQLSATTFTALELAGSCAFAISGALVAVRRRMDIFGVLVLAFVTAVAGGTARDVILGVTPPEAFRGWHVLAIAVAAALVCFFAGRRLERARIAVQVFDAAGLGLFAVTGTQKALESGIDPAMAVVLGVLTGIGGGIARDVLASRAPIVLHAEIYALAALAAAVVVAGAHAFGLGGPLVAVPAVAICFALRMTAIARRWSLPPAQWSPLDAERSGRPPLGDREP